MYKMNKVQSTNPVQAYLEGMLWASFSVKIFEENVAEWQIDAAKECAKNLKEKEIDHSSLTPIKKEEQKKLWNQWIDETTKGFKDVLKADGRLV